MTRCRRFTKSVYRRKCRLRRLVRKNVITEFEAEILLAAYTRLRKKGFEKEESTEDSK